MEEMKMQKAKNQYIISSTVLALYVCSKGSNNMKTMSTRLIRFLIILLPLSCALTAANAQYYPGGLGNGNLQLWLTGSDATTLQQPSGAQAANGNFIAKWVDKSGNNNHAVQATGGTQPVLQTNALNGNSAVIFQNNTELLTGPSGAYQTIVGVRNLAGTGHYQYFFSSPANQDFSIRGGGQSSVYTDGPNVNDWTYNTGATATQWTNGAQTLNASTTNHIIVATAQATTNATYSISSTFLNRGMNGNDPVYEILAYNMTLNTTQRQILENYEAATWGLASALPTSGYTVFTPPAAASFNRNLVGIGYTSATDNVLANAATSTDGLGFSSTSGATGFLNSAGFLMAAHNGQANSVNTNATIPGIRSSTALSLWGRSWYLQKSGGNAAGQVTLNFNFTQYNSSTPNGASVYALLYNATDGTFATGTNKLITTTATIVSGGTVSFTVNAANLANGYYAITYSSSPIILPLQLTDFTVSAQQNDALLDWTVQQDVNIDHFNVQRSTDGSSFTSIGAVSARTGNAGPEQYSFVDEKPATSISYYRIESVDADGSLTYSGIRTFRVTTAETATVTIYPNPATDRLHIATTGTGTVSILIIDVQGRVLRRVEAASGNAVDVPVNDLAKGVYFAKIVAGGSGSTHEFMKN
jgi:hypothetical protein